MPSSAIDGFQHPVGPRRPRGVISLLGGSRAISIAAMLILYVALGTLYDQVVAARYAFGAFRLSPRDDSWIELLTVAMAGLLLPTDPKRMSQIFAWLATVFLLVPAAVLSAYQGSDRYAMFLMFGGVWAVMLVCRLLAEFKVSFRIDPRPAEAEIRMGQLLGVLGLILLAVAVHVGGALNLSFSEVYEFRFDFNADLIFPLNYLLPFAAGPLTGLVVASALYKRRQDTSAYAVLAVTMISGLLFFGFSSHKAFLFYPLFVIMIYWAVESRAGHLYLVGIFLALTLATFLFSSTGGGDILGSSFANRLVFIPAQIHYFFFREFGEIGPQFWAESRIGLGIKEPDIPLPSVNYIGLIMIGDPIVGANTGWIANGYMNAREFGIALYAVILGCTLHVIDRLGARYDYRFVSAAFVIPIFSLVNSTDLFVGFLTGGLMLLFIVFFWTVGPRRVKNARREAHDSA